MKTFTKAMLIFATCIGLSGVFFVIGGFIAGGKIDDLIVRYVSTKERTNESYRFTDTIDSIDVHIDAAEANIEYGDNFGVDLQNVEKDAVEVKVDGRTLKVKEKSGKVFGGNFRYSWPFQINVGNNSSANLKITIYLPKETILKEADIEACAGNIEIDELVAQKGKWEVDTGRIKADKVTLSEESKLSVSVGSITIDKFIANDSSLSADVGSIEVAGELTGECKADCNIGSITLRLNQREEEFDYRIESELGKVRLNSESYHGDEKKITHDAANSLKLSCDIGKISVTTEE